MKKIIKHYPKTGRLIVTLGYSTTLLTCEMLLSVTSKLSSENNLDKPKKKKNNTNITFELLIKYIKFRIFHFNFKGIPKV
jgi:hypothetical protein